MASVSISRGLSNLSPAGSSRVKVLSNCRSSRVASPAALPLLAPVAVLAADDACGSASMMVEGARAAEGEAAAAMALALPPPELLLMLAVGAGQVGARRPAAAPQAPVAHGCGAWRAPREAAALLPRCSSWRTGRAAAAVFSVRPNREGAPAAMTCSGVASQRKFPTLQVAWRVPHWPGRGRRQDRLGRGVGLTACLRRLGRSAAAAGASRSSSSPRAAAANRFRDHSDRRRAPRQLGRWAHRRVRLGAVS